MGALVMCTNAVMQQTLANLCQFEATVTLLPVCSKACVQDCHIQLLQTTRIRNVNMVKPNKIVRDPQSTFVHRLLKLL